GEGLERTELVGDVRAHLLGGGVHGAAAEPDEIGEAGVSTDVDPADDAVRDSAAHDARHSCVEPKGDVARAHHLQQGGVIAHAPAPEPFSEIGDEINVTSHSAWAPLLK